MSKLIEVQNLSKTYPLGGKTLHALKNISFSIEKGQTLGLIGESGSGKSTLARVLIGLNPSTAGKMFLEGHLLPAKRTLALVRKMQMVFQDPYASLDPRMTVEQILKEPGEIHKLPIDINRLLELVNLPATVKTRYPHEFSGGQRQRIAIARAISLKPDLLICDESLSALDASIQSQIAALLLRLQNELQLTYLFISHDLNLIRRISTQVAVMYLGHFVEIGPTELVFSRPLHPYTQLLLASAPLINPIEERKRVAVVLKGDPPSPLNPPKGCPFSTRCPSASELCHNVAPQLRWIDGRYVACHLHDVVKNNR